VSEASVTPGSAAATPASAALRTGQAAATMGPLVASLGVVELAKLLEGSHDNVLLGRELYVDARHHRFYVSKLVRNPECRFDHETWEATPLAERSLEAVLRAAPGASELSLEGDELVGEVCCRACATPNAVWKPRARLTPAERRCRQCGAALEPAGFELFDALSAAQVPQSMLRAPLSALGILPQDIVTIRSPRLARGSARSVCQRFEVRGPQPAPMSPGDTLVVAGCGNIGSHLIPLLARLTGVGRVVLIDPDTYERHNLANQNIHPDDVGRPKVDVQAERLRALAPTLQVEPVCAPLEAVPMGRYRGAILVGALDSRRARQGLNTRAFRVGSPFIDLAVDGVELMCRVAVYWPGASSACQECGWGEGDYALLEQRLACDAVASEHESKGPASAGPSEGSSAPVTESGG